MQINHSFLVNIESNELGHWEETLLKIGGGGVTPKTHTLMMHKNYN